MEIISRLQKYFQDGSGEGSEACKGVGRGVGGRGKGGENEIDDREVAGVENPKCRVLSGKFQGHPTTVFYRMLLDAVLGYLEYF